MKKGFLNKIFSYDEVTGNLLWKVSFSNRSSVGSIAGHIDDKGYRIVTINKKPYKASRLVWIYHNGSIPNGMIIDHKDRNPKNNKIENLRLATYSQNNANKRTRNKIGLKGVSRNGRGFQARIKIDGKLKTLGTFNTPELAHEAYKNEANKVYGEFVNTN